MPSVDAEVAVFLRIYCADIKLVQADDALQICKEVTDLLSLGRICRVRVYPLSRR